MSRWLSIYLPLLPLEVFQHCDKQQAFAVLEKQKVLACNNIATKKGVDIGLKQSSALAICSSIHFAERDLQKEQALLNNIAESMYRFSSQVITHTNTRNEHSLIIEIARSLRLFGGIKNLMLAITACLRGLLLNHNDENKTEFQPAFQYSFALSSTIKSSEILARYLFSKKIISIRDDSNDNPSPKNGFKQLFQIDVNFLDCSQKHILACESLGIKNIGELYSLPMSTLGKRFSLKFIQYLKQVEGRQPDPQHFFSPPNFFYRDFFYLDGIPNQQQLQHPIKKLLHLLCDYLRDRQLKCQQLNWQFTRFSKQKNGITVRLSQADNNYDSLLYLSALQIDKLPLDSPVECIALRVDIFTALEIEHQDLFLSSTSQAIDGNFHLLADTLHARLGEDTVKQLVKHNEHAPEKSNQLSSLTKTTPLTNSKAKKTYCTDSHEKPRHMRFINSKPIWLINPPELLKEHNGKLFRGSQHLTIVRGPERIDNHWWDDPIYRDYFIAVARGSRCSRNLSPIINGFYWIYQEKPSLDKNQHIKKRSAWYLHGIYS